MRKVRLLVALAFVLLCAGPSTAQEADAPERPTVHVYLAGQDQLDAALRGSGLPDLANLIATAFDFGGLVPPATRDRRLPTAAYRTMRDNARPSDRLALVPLLRGAAPVEELRQQWNGQPVPGQPDAFITPANVHVWRTPDYVWFGGTPQQRAQQTERDLFDKATRNPNLLAEAAFDLDAFRQTAPKTFTALFGAPGEAMPGRDRLGNPLSSAVATVMTRYMRDSLHGLSASLSADGADLQAKVVATGYEVPPADIKRPRPVFPTGTTVRLDMLYGRTQFVRGFDLLCKTVIREADKQAGRKLGLEEVFDVGQQLLRPGFGDAVSLGYRPIGQSWVLYGVVQRDALDQFAAEVPDIERGLNTFLPTKDHFVQRSSYLTQDGLRVDRLTIGHADNELAHIDLLPAPKLKRLLFTISPSPEKRVEPLTAVPDRGQIAAVAELDTTVPGLFALVEKLGGSGLPADYKADGPERLRCTLTTDGKALTLLISTPLRTAGSLVRIFGLADIP
jgi:hypothetical protein